MDRRTSAEELTPSVCLHAGLTCPGENKQERSVSIVCKCSRGREARCTRQGVEGQVGTLPAAGPVQQWEEGTRARHAHAMHAHMPSTPARELIHMHLGSVD